MLLETVEHIRNVIAVSQATTYENLFSHLFSVEQKYIHPLIEGALYNKLLEFLKTPTAFSSLTRRLTPIFLIISSKSFHLKSLLMLACYLLPKGQSFIWPISKASMF
jgi:hypothetical protein